MATEAKKATYPSVYRYPRILPSFLGRPQRNMTFKASGFAAPALVCTLLSLSTVITRVFIINEF